MAHQALDHSEVLNVRWATVDPNPLAQKREAARIEEQAAEAVRQALPADFVAELEGRETGDMKRRRLLESGFGLEGYEAPDEVWFARSKELEAQRNSQAQVEGAAEVRLIETVPQSTEVMGPVSDQNSGILSSATIAALKDYSNTGTSCAPAAATVPSGAPLVAYGSDDDSD
jgi:hypothetical protein